MTVSVTVDADVVPLRFTASQAWDLKQKENDDKNPGSLDFSEKLK